MRRSLFAATMLSSGLAFGLFASPVYAVELISNGGFENGTFNADGTGGLAHYDTISAGDVQQDLSSWTITHGSAAWGLGATDINTHAGSGFVDLTGVGDNGNHGTISQTISTIAGQTYAFSIFETLYFGAGGITVNHDGVAFALSGIPGIWSPNNQGVGPATWGQLTGTFIADGSSTTINIVGNAGSTFMIGLDDASVMGPSIGAVPEPSTWAMLLLGFAGLALAGHRRARRNKAVA
jgi:hypothetical protein